MAEKNSFDLVRITAAYAVMVSHSFAMAGLPEPKVLPEQSLGRTGVIVFFALSGYLVTHSLYRDPRLLSFLAKRALRIFPGLAVVLAFTVLVLGPVFSSLPIGDYFANGETWRYLGKIKLWGHDRLPGVFEHNHYPGAVNASLWTLKWEWAMYLLLGGLALLAARWRITAITALLLVFASLALLSKANGDLDAVPLLGPLEVSRNPFPLGSFFLLGALLGALKVHSGLRLGAAAHGVFVVAAMAAFWAGSPIGWQVGLWLLVPGIILAVGESGWSGRLGIKIRHDISYGVYIYAFPIQQAVASAWDAATWWQSLLLSTPLTATLAYLSWRFVEKPALSLKTRVSRPPTGP